MISSLVHPVCWLPHISQFESLNHTQVKNQAAYLLLMRSQVAMHFLWQEEGDTHVHSEPHVQHSLFDICQAEDINVVCGNGEHLGQKVYQKMVAAPLLPSQFCKLPGRHVCGPQWEE